MKAIQTADLVEYVTVKNLRVIADIMFRVIALAMMAICTLVAWFSDQNPAIFLVLAGAGALGVNAAVVLFSGRLRARLLVAALMAFQAMVIIDAASKLSAAFVQEAHMFYYVIDCLLLAYVCWRTLAVFNFIALSWLSILTFIDPARLWSPVAGSDGPLHLAIHVLIAVTLIGPLVFAAVILQSTFSNNEKTARTSWQAIEEARASAVEAIREHQAADSSARRISGTAADIGSQLQNLFANILKAARETDRSALSLATVSHACSDTTRTVETLFDRAASNLDDVVTAADFLSQSFVEVADRAAAAERQARDAVEESVQISHLVEALEGSSQQVDDITRIIRKVAASINLIALNATIEAARAGRSGRGFAVVAQNVKALAGETRKATEEIDGVISTIKDETRNAARTIKAIGDTIKFAHDHVLDIAVSTATQTTMTASIVEITSSTAREASNVRTRLAATRHSLVAAKTMSDDLIGASSRLQQMTETSTITCASLLARLHHA